MNSGQQLWQKAKHLIPGGGQLLSKRAERFLPGQWPAYYNRAKGCEVWDLDGNKYYDFAQMGVGACVLGYADEDVNKAVHKAVDNGNMCTLNCPEELDLAERLTALHPWAEKARFARTGGEACAIAVRIGRAASGKGRVAFCGYHGWHDWYLAANLSDDSNLDGQLLPGLDPAGVYRGLKGSAMPFNYNSLDELETLAAEYDDIGVIIMEPQRGNAPAPGFLEGVRAVADRIGAVLIFDEVTSGFRMNMGGIHMTYDVHPDVTVFGKALGNGYPIAAIIGRGEIMEAAQSSFISSTMWTERIGYVAALETLDKMGREDVPVRLTAFGERINAGWAKVAGEHGISIHVDGIPPLTHLRIQEGQPMEAATFYAQEMLKRGYLVGAAVYSSNSYSEEIIDGFIAHTGEVFAMLREKLEAGTLRQGIEGDLIQTGFKRLT